MSTLEEAIKIAAQEFGEKIVGAMRQAEQDEKENMPTVDGRSLRATGRTAQFNFKCLPEIKSQVYEAAEAEGLTVAEWMERAMLAALRGKL